MLPRARPGSCTPGSAGPDALVVVVEAPILPTDIKGLCTRLCGLLDGSDAPRVVCDVAAFAEPDAVTIDALAQFQLAVRRRGKSIELRNASARMRGLLSLMGLSEVFVFVSDLTS
jgi:ABC-type transporter Mla MlaB component